MNESMNEWTHRTRWSSLFWMETSLRSTSRMRSFSSLVNVSHATLISAKLIALVRWRRRWRWRPGVAHGATTRWELQQPNNRMNDFMFDFFRFLQLMRVYFIYYFIIFFFPLPHSGIESGSGRVERTWHLICDFIVIYCRQQLIETVKLITRAQSLTPADADWLLNAATLLINVKCRRRIGIWSWWSVPAGCAG